MIAVDRRVRHRSLVFVADALLGWTVVVWVGLLFWAVRGPAGITAATRPEPRIEARDAERGR